MYVYVTVGLNVRHVCMHTGLYVFPYDLQGQKVLSVSQISCTGKWIQLFTEAVLPFNFNFQHTYRTQLTGKPSAPFERALNLGLETSLRFYIYFVFDFVHDFFCL